MKSFIQCFKNAYQECRTKIRKDEKEEITARRRYNYQYAKLMESVVFIDVLFSPFYFLRCLIDNIRKQHSDLQSKLT